MAEITKANRIIRILQRLALQREVTVDDLYRHFEGQVPKRSLQRDLVDISAANIPLRERVGSNRRIFWSIDRDYLKFVPVTLETREVIAGHILKSLAGLFRGTPLERDARSLVQKARQLYPVEIVADLDSEAVDHSFGFTQIGLVDYSSFGEIIDMLIGAISRRRAIVVDYKPHWRATASHINGHPYMLVFHKGALYLVLYSLYYRRFILLAVQRMQSVSEAGDRFKRDPGFSLDKVRQGRFGIFGQEGMRPRRVVLRFSPEIADAVAERIWHSSQKLRREKTGHLILEMTVLVTDELLGWIASWRHWVEIVHGV